MPIASLSPFPLGRACGLLLTLLCGLGGLAGLATAAPPDSPAGWIGYNLHRTNLQGGRWANVRTNRAMVIQGDGSGNRLVGEPLLDEPGYWTQFVGWSPDGSLTILGRVWESEENGRWEEEHQNFRFTEPGGMRIEADGGLSMGYWSIKESKQLDIRYHPFGDEYLPKENSLPPATVLFVSGVKGKPSVTLNQKDVTGSLKAWKYDGREGWLVPLTGAMPDDAKIAARLLAATQALSAPEPALAQ